MRTARIVVPALLALVAVAAWSPCTADAKGRGGGGGGGGSSSSPAITFVMDGDIMVMNADGTNMTRVWGEAYAHDPVWSPDGSRIAYMAGSSATNYSLYSIKPDGKRRKTLASNLGTTNGIGWSPVAAPDGESKIAFTRFSGPPPSDVWVINTDGTGLQNLTQGAYGDCADIAWSPDGTRIVVTCPHNIKILELDAASGGGLTIADWTKISHVSGSLLGAILAADDENAPDRPDWSRDGSRIAFGLIVQPTDGVSTWDWDTWILDLDDPANPYPVTTTSGLVREYNPSWSPGDARLVVYRVGTATANPSEIVTMDPDGTNVTVLVAGDVRDPDWKR